MSVNKGNGSSQGMSRRMNLSGFNPLRQKGSKNKQVYSSYMDSSHEEDDLKTLPPPKVRAGSSATIEAIDEFHFDSAKLQSLRRQHFRSSMVVPPKQKKEHFGRLTVVLDLDETLIHSQISPSSSLKAMQDRSVEGSGLGGKKNLEYFELSLSDGERVTVFKRPRLDEFLKSVSEKYEIMAYTAGLKQYAEPLLNWLDPEGAIFAHRLYRDNCLFASGYYVKDLKMLNRPLKRTVLVDNNLCCFLPQLSNGIPISSFYDDPRDDALNVLKTFLESLESESDVRPILTKSFNLTDSLKQTRQLLLG